jgi:hypothetical protein
MPIATLSTFENGAPMVPGLTGVLRAVAGGAAT